MPFRLNAICATGGPRTRVWIVVLMMVLGMACSRDEAPRQIDFSQRQDVTLQVPPADRLTYAYLPQFSHAVSFERHHRLVSYLAEATGYDVVQIFPDTFDEHMRMVGQGQIDISFSNPYIYVMMAHRYCVRAFARIIESGGHERFRGEIIVRADNQAIRSLADCRGKRWMAVDPFSAGGYLYALGLFWDHGITPQDFAEIAFAPGPGGKQEKVILAVHAGQYDVGTVREGALAVLADRIDLGELRVIGRTGWYPGWVYATRAGLAPQIVARVGQALVALDTANPQQRGILENAHIRAIVPSEDRDFDPVRDLWNQVGGERLDCRTIAADPPGQRQ